jgi:hypothetical protein
MLPDPYRRCGCGEWRTPALRCDGGCFNCTAPAHHPRGRCDVCERDGLPLEQHHIAGRALSSSTISICINCHRIIARPLNALMPLLTEIRQHDADDSFVVFVGGAICLLRHIALKLSEDPAGFLLSKPISVPGDDALVLAIACILGLWLISTMLSSETITNAR